MIYVKGDLGLGAEVLAWPPTLGLLGPQGPRETWTPEDLLAHIDLLEREGQSLAAELEHARYEANLLRLKLRRAKKGGEWKARTLLDAFDELPVKRKGGRPKGSRGRPIAERAVALLLTMREQSGRRITQKQALAELFRQEGKAAYRVRENRSVINEMSRIMKAQSQKRR